MNKSCYPRLLSFITLSDGFCEKISTERQLDQLVFKTARQSRIRQIMYVVSENYTL